MVGPVGALGEGCKRNYSLGTGPRLPQLAERSPLFAPNDFPLTRGTRETHPGKAVCRQAAQNSRANPLLGVANLSSASPPVRPSSRRFSKSVNGWTQLSGRPD